MDAQTRQLVRRLQRDEDAERKQRVARLVRALNGVGKNFHNEELTQIESIAFRAYGRVQLEK